MKVRSDQTAVNGEIEAVQFARLQIQDRIQNMSKTIIANRNKPILNTQLEAEINAVMAQFLNRGKWIDWGMDSIRKQGNAVLLYGPPGTGKTTIAEYMSKKLGKGLMTLNMKDVGGKTPGSTERQTHQFFIDAAQAGYKTVFLDECEAIVIDRRKAASDSLYMVGVIDEILMQVATYKGLVVLATNQVSLIDYALRDRCFACLQISEPEYPERIRLWQQKIPKRFPVQPTQAQYEKLAQHELNGRQIVNAIVREASHALTSKRIPSLSGLYEQAEWCAKFEGEENGNS